MDLDQGLYVEKIKRIAKAILASVAEETGQDSEVALKVVAELLQQKKNEKVMELFKSTVKDLGIDTDYIHESKTTQAAN